MDRRACPRDRGERWLVESQVFASAWLKLGVTGLQVVVDDYVHSDVKFAAVIAVRLVCFTLGAAGILATLRISLGP